MKRCRICKQDKELSEFQSDSTRPDKLDPRCRDCKRLYYRIQRQTHKDTFKRKDQTYYLKHREEIIRKRSDNYQRDKYKIRARNMVKVALYNGILSHQPCEICGIIDTHAHHDNYNFPLDVRWLCPVHHCEWHMINGEGVY